MGGSGFGGGMSTGQMIGSGKDPKLAGVPGFGAGGYAGYPGANVSFPGSGVGGSGQSLGDLFSGGITQSGPMFGGGGSTAPGTGTGSGGGGGFVPPMPQMPNQSQIGAAAQNNPFLQSMENGTPPQMNFTPQMGGSTIPQEPLATPGGGTGGLPMSSQGPIGHSGPPPVVPPQGGGQGPGQGGGGQPPGPGQPPGGPGNPPPGGSPPIGQNPMLTSMLNTPFWQGKNNAATQAAFSPPAFKQAQQFYPQGGQQTTMQALQALMGGTR